MFRIFDFFYTKFIRFLYQFNIVFVILILSLLFFDFSFLNSQKIDVLSQTPNSSVPTDPTLPNPGVEIRPPSSETNSSNNSSSQQNSISTNQTSSQQNTTEVENIETQSGGTVKTGGNTNVFWVVLLTTITILFFVNKFFEENRKIKTNEKKINSKKT